MINVLSDCSLVNAGELLTTINYNSFGNILEITDPNVADRYTFTGREYDEVIDLYYYRARWYDPHTGRFLSQDPLSFGAGDANLYRYVFNGPTNYTDPSGMATFTETAAKMTIPGAFAGALSELVCGLGEAYFDKGGPNGEPPATPGEITPAEWWSITQRTIAGGVAGAFLNVLVTVAPASLGVGLTTSLTMVQSTQNLVLIAEAAALREQGHHRAATAKMICLGTQLVADFAADFGYPQPKGVPGGGPGGPGRPGGPRKPPCNCFVAGIGVDLAEILPEQNQEFSLLGYWSDYGWVPGVLVGIGLAGREYSRRKAKKATTNSHTKIAAESIA